jgi:hypothetical protein
MVHINDSKKSCVRCNNSLGIISHQPNENWMVQGKLCKNCHSHVKSQIHTFKVRYVRGYSEFPSEVDGTLTVQLFDDINRIIFKPDKKDYPILQITYGLLTNCDIITEKEASLKRLVFTAGMSKTKDKSYLRIGFINEHNNNNMQEFVIFDISHDMDVAYNTLCLVRAKTEATNQKIQKDYWI